MLREYDLQQMAEEMGLNRSIGPDLFCSECRYRLRGLPYRGRCPECGSDYNAKSLWKDGVISAGWIDPPVRDYAATVALMFPGLLSVIWGLFPMNAVRIGLGGVLIACGLVYARKAWIKTARLIHIRRLVREIDDESA